MFGSTKPQILLLSFLFICCQTNQNYLEKHLPEGFLKGDWVTNVGSDAIKSKFNIQSLISHCKKYEINNLFVVLRNKGVTKYPSSLLKKYIGMNQEQMLSHFDPLATLIEEAHNYGLRVHAWFEFGFSLAYNDPESLCIQKYTEWLGK